ncbi:GntR family transcriptional regulator [Paenibacillus sabinae]|uniref:Transcriptional regulator n=1 Tax=Paenibacillus sabinae T27 TaxID=1268072 RepID=X4Z8H8_9BACL|nr:GntR family transcriptional regulator [Paenibacillus sabinae]AHV96011.1 transcriptional regulator [Paenibacillus sabinae T27]
MLPKSTTKVKRTSIREQVYLQIQEWIISGELKPGDKLKDQQLAEAMGTSRTPIREALLRLEEEGMVQTKANSWTQVAPVDVHQAHRLYPVIWTLEKLAVSFAEAHIKPEHIRQLETINEELERALEQENALDAQQCDARFHQVIIDLSANEELIGVLYGLKNKLRRYEVAYFNGFSGAEQSVEEHKAIITALKEENWAAAAENIEANWKNSFRRRFAASETDGIRKSNPPEHE